MRTGMTYGYTRSQRMRLAAGLVCLLALPGCQNLEGLLDSLGGKPSARVTGVNFQEFSLDGATLGFDVEVTNPYAVPLPLLDLKYGLASGAEPFLSGDIQLDDSIEARGSKLLTLPARVNFAELFGALTGLKPGAVVPYAMDMEIGVDAPGLGPLSLPLRKQGELPVPTVPDVELESVAWDKLSLDEATATLKLRVGNTNSFPIDLDTLAYNLALGGSTVANTSLARAVSMSPGEDALLEIPISFAPKSLGFAVFNMLMGEGGGYELGGTMSVDTPFGALDMPFQRSGDTTFKR